MTSKMNSFDGSGMGAFRKSPLSARNDEQPPWVHFLTQSASTPWLDVNSARSIYRVAGFQVGTVKSAFSFTEDELKQTRLIHYLALEFGGKPAFFDKMIDDSWPGRFVVHMFLPAPPAPGSAADFMITHSGISHDFENLTSIPGGVGGIRSTVLGSSSILLGVSAIYIGQVWSLTGGNTICNHTYGGQTIRTIREKRIPFGLATTRWVMLGARTLFGGNSPENTLVPLAHLNAKFLVNLAVR